MPKLRLAVLIALSLSAVTLTADTFSEGKAALTAGNYDKAIELFEKAIAAEPKNAKYHYYLGAAYGEAVQRAGMLKKASLASKTRNALEKAVELDPNYLEPRLALIDYYMMAPGFMGGSPEKAKEQAAAIAKHDPLQGHRAMARVYARDKKPDLARNEYVVAVRENPTSAKAHYYLATFLIAEKNFTGGLQEVEAAMKLDPSYMPPVFRMGVYSATSGKDFERGEQALKKYLAYTPAENEPPHSSAWYWLGQLYEKQGKKADAKNAYLQAKKLAPASKEIEEALKRVS